LQGCGRPVEDIVRLLASQKLQEADEILRQIDPNWAPPHYDPFLMAQALGIRCKAVDAPWLTDAMIFVQEGQPRFSTDRIALRCARRCWPSFIPFETLLEAV